MPEDLSDTEDDDDTEMSVRLQLLERSDHEVCDVSFQRTMDITYKTSAIIDRSGKLRNNDRISGSSSLHFDSLQPYEPAESKLSDFQLLKVIGRGSYAKVLLAEHRRTKRQYAIKAMKKDVIGDDDVSTDHLLSKSSV